MTRITTKSIYFTHDSNARNDVKVLALRKKHKLVGYALYFLLLEQLSASNDYKISMNNIDDLAFDFRIDDTSIIQDIIENYDLFTIEDGYFYSKAHREKMQYKDEKADKKRELILARMAGLTPEELSKQNQKAARAKWDKYNAEKSKNNDSAQSSCIGCTDVSASDALNKNKNKDKYKD